MKLVDIARLAGVSKTTASIILNGRADHYRISQKTTDRVMKLAAEHHYIANAQAAGLRSRNSRLMALILPDLMHHGFAELSKYLERLARKAGFHLLISSSDDNPATEEALVKTLIGRKVEAIISVACLRDYGIYHYAQSRGVPVILLDRRQPETDLDFIVSDDHHSASALTRALLENSQGDLVYFGGNENMVNSRQRLAGFQEALESSDYCSGDIKVFQQDYSVEAGYEMMSAYYRETRTLPRHLFTASLTLMEGAFQYLRQYRDKISGNWLWVTFGDSYILDLMPFTIHSARQKYQQMAELAMANLQKKLASQPYERQQVLEREIIHRRF